MKQGERPGFFYGALTGAFLTAPLVAIFYLAWKLFGLPFVPFSVFDWVSRVLPGSLITFGIDSMVKLIRSLRLGDTASAAKAAEQGMAIVVFLVAASSPGCSFSSLCARGGGSRTRRASSWARLRGRSRSSSALA